MKKITIAVLGLALVAGTFTSCKKGENDPALSLTSRKARVSGEWMLSSASSEGTYTFKDEDSNFTQTTSTEYDGEQEITSYTFDGNTSYDTIMYTQEMTINKDGSFTAVYESTWDGGSYKSETEGSWAFVGKSKDADLKKKEAIIISVTDEQETNTFTGGSSTQSSTRSAFSDGDILIIDQLKSKEMIVLTDRMWEDVDGNEIETYTSTGTQTYTAK